MRRARMTAALAALAAAAGGCADRPNDLDTYYDDPPPAVDGADASSPSASAGPESSSVTPGREPAASGDPALRRAVENAVLTDVDVAGEEVVPVRPGELGDSDPGETTGPGSTPNAPNGPDGPGGAGGVEERGGTAEPGEPVGAEPPGVPEGAPRAEPGCLDAVAPGDGPEPQYRVWQYPTGSALKHTVAAYPERPAADVVSELPCAGERIAVPGAEAADGYEAWCSAGTCTLVVTRGAVLSGVEVQATDRGQALEAIERLAPVTAGKLG